MNQYYDIKTYKQYDRDVKLAVRRGLDMEQLLTVVDMLRKGETLPPKYHNHLLHGDYKGYWECHINPDWLLLYEKDTEIRIISLYRTGTLSDIFGKGKKRLPPFTHKLQLFPSKNEFRPLAPKFISG
jgi:mRNA interferase YafQ